MNNIRYLRLTRESKLLSAIIPFRINIDGQWVAELCNGKTINIPLDYSEHKFYMQMDSQYKGKTISSISEVLKINADEFDHGLYCYFKMGWTVHKLLWKIDEEQEQKNNQILVERAHRSKIDAEIKNIISSVCENPVGNRDFSMLNQLSEEARNSEFYFNQMKIIKEDYVSCILKYFVEDQWGYERCFSVLNDLCSIPEYRNDYMKYMKHFDYYMANNAIVSILGKDDPVGDIQKISEIKNMHELVPNSIFEIIDLKKYWEEGNTEKALDTLFLVNVEEADLINLKKWIIISAINEGASDNDSKKYTVLMNLHNTVNKIIFDSKPHCLVNSVDEIIAETIRGSYTKTFSKVDELLDVFLSRTSEWLRIDNSQYSILQKVFSYSEAYEQEKKVLEAMVEKCIPRTQEQEHRLSFLQTSNVKNGYLQEESIKQDEIFQEGSCMYEYRSVHWDVHKIDEFFESLSLRNTTVEYPFVVREWNKDVNIKNVEVDITELVIRMQNVFKESFNDRFDVGITNIKTLDNYADYVEAVLIDETDLDTGYSWILFFVTGERINNKQVAFSIYTLYIPLLDTDVIALENNIIEKNKVCAQKIKLLKEMQNPRINRHIQNVNDLIISVLEKWSNEEKEHIDIYG